jgi:hypothetical protein
LFNKAREYIQSRCDRWYILSAKYGLVPPDQVIEPYEETLNTKSHAEREEWAASVWQELERKLECGDKLTILAGARYREFLLPMLKEHGCLVEIPLEGKPIGTQLQWLTQQLCQPQRERDLDHLYGCLRKLEAGLGGKRTTVECSGRMKWPRSGLYFFFEPGECRAVLHQPRVVRVGTHGVSRGSTATLWNRLRTHRGSGDGLGNHRSSIFRLHVGAALAAKDTSLATRSWGKGQVADREVRDKEKPLEEAVSRYIGAMSILWLAIEDESSPASDRAYLERNLIGLLVGPAGPIDSPTTAWLGLFSPDRRIRASGLWNLDFLDYKYDPLFLDVLERYVDITIGLAPAPSRSLAPPRWYKEERLGTPHDQLTLFPEE